jgi:hypothetical protein
MTIYLGNLTIEQIEKEYGVNFSEKDKQWLSEHHQDQASGIEKDKWHFFDIPRIMMTGSNEFAKEIYDRFVKYSFKGQFRIAW